MTSLRPEAGRPTSGRGAVTPILMYHAIARVPRCDFSPFAVPPEQFERHLRALRALDFEGLTMREWRERASRGTLPERSVVLTFDDGYQDLLTAALPLLRRYGYPATVFVPTAWVGRALRVAPDAALPLLTWRDLATLAAADVEIGAHSHGHASLGELPTGDLDRDLQRGRRELEENLGLRVTSFAYPYGHHDRRVRDAVIRAGFDVACAVTHLHARPNDPTFALPRLLAAPDLTDSNFEQLVTRPDTRAARTARRVAESLKRTARNLGVPWRTRPDILEDAP